MNKRAINSNNIIQGVKRNAGCEYERNRNRVGTKRSVLHYYLCRHPNAAEWRFL